MRKVCDIVMLSAGEALAIAREVSRADIELQEIESYIKEEAMDGKYEVNLHPSIPYHPKTIATLKQFGYEVVANLDQARHRFAYRIKWGEE